MRMLQKIAFGINQHELEEQDMSISQNMSIKLWFYFSHTKNFKQTEICSQKYTL